MQPQDVLDFWFSGEATAKWFKPDDDFDTALRDRFGASCGKALSGELRAWTETPDGCLALVILLDQIPRNIFRGTPAAFSGDAQALETAKLAIANGHEDRLEQMERYMLYMPYMHSEDIEAQDRGLQLFEALGMEKPLDYMKRHRDIIVRFGRFPHRNGILGRENTPEEEEFLQQPGSRF